MKIRDNTQENTVTKTSRIQQKHPVIYRIGYSFRALWTQTMYENIVVFCVIFSKMSFENGNMF